MRNFFKKIKKLFEKEVDGPWVKLESGGKEQKRRVTIRKAKVTR